MMPQKLRERFSTEQVREWFDSADTDNSGQVSISEYYLFTMRTAAQMHGDDIISAIFAKYDPVRLALHCCDQGWLEPTVCLSAGFVRRTGPGSLT